MNNGDYLNLILQIDGLQDKAVVENCERVQAALHASGVSMPAKKVTVFAPPADLLRCSGYIPNNNQSYSFKSLAG